MTTATALWTWRSSWRVWTTTESPLIKKRPRLFSSILTATGAGPLTLMSFSSLWGSAFAALFPVLLVFLLLTNLLFAAFSRRCLKPGRRWWCKPFGSWIRQATGWSPSKTWGESTTPSTTQSTRTASGVRIKSSGLSWTASIVRMTKTER